jgi:hypothetical protein
MEYQQLSLRQSAQHDKAKNLKDQITGWGFICMMRAEKKTARKYKPGYKKYQGKKTTTY